MILIPPKDIGIIENKIRPMLEKAFDKTSEPQIDTADGWIALLKNGAVYCFVSRDFEFCVYALKQTIYFI